MVPMAPELIHPCKNPVSIIGITYLLTRNLDLELKTPVKTNDHRRKFGIMVRAWGLGVAGVYGRNPAAPSVRDVLISRTGLCFWGGLGFRVDFFHQQWESCVTWPLTMFPGPFRIRDKLMQIRVYVTA